MEAQRAVPTVEDPMTDDLASLAGSTDTEQLWNAPLAMATIAHDIRNPLLSVSANIELLQNQLDRHDPRRRCADRALTEVDRLSGVVDRLVEFASTHRADLERVNLGAFIREATDRERDRVTSPAVQVELDGEDTDVEVFLDPRLMMRVIANLVRNAVESMPEGGRVHVSIWQEGPREVLVRIDDEGEGVKAGMAETIFEPFVTTKSTGTGLGLPFSRRIARVHGGDLRAVERRGGRFELRLPVAPAQGSLA